MTVRTREEILAKTRVLIVDDHSTVRRGLTDLLDQQPDLSVCGAVASAEQALDFLPDQHVDLAIVDISLGQMDGLQLTRQLSRDYPHLCILVLSMQDPASCAERALDAGACGFVAKAQAVDTLLTAIHQVLNGGTYVSPSPGVA